MEPAAPMNIIVEHQPSHGADDSYWTPSQRSENSINSPTESVTPPSDILDVYNNAFARLSVEIYLTRSGKMPVRKIKTPALTEPQKRVA